MADNALSFAITAIDQASAVFASVGQNVEGLSGQAAASSSKMSENLAKASAVIVTAGVAAAGGLYKIGSTFDEVSDTIRAGTGATGANLDGLVEVAKNVGKQAPFEFAKIAPVVSDLNTRLGLTGDSLETVAQQVLQAGKLLGSDVDINQTAAAFKAFGLTNDQVSAGMDSLFRASQATGVGMNTLASAVQTAGPALNNLGFSFEDSIALMGSLDKAGLNAEQVAGSLNRGLISLAKSGEAPVDAFHRVIGEMQGFIDSGDTASALALSGSIFGTRGASQFVAAMQAGVLNVDNLTAAAGVSSDTILGVAKDTSDMSEQWQMFKNRALVAIEPVATKVFGVLAEGMQWINDKGIPFLTQYKDVFIPLGVVLGVVAGGIVAATVAVRAWTVAQNIAATAQKVWTAIVWLWNAAMSANPVMLIVIGIAALVAGIILAYQHSETFRAIVTGAFDAVLGAVKFVWHWVSDNWPLLLAILTGPIGLAVLAITSNWDTIKNAFTSVKDWIGEKWGEVVGFFGTGKDKIVEFFGDMADKITAPFKAAFKVVAQVWNATIGKISFTIPDWVKYTGVGIPFAGKSFNVPDIPVPGLWEGATVLARSGGTLVRVAERGRAESVVDTGLMNTALRRGLGGSGGGNEYHFHVDGVIGDKQAVVRWLRDAAAEMTRQGLLPKGAF